MKAVEAAEKGDPSLPRPPDIDVPQLANLDDSHHLSKENSAAAAEDQKQDTLRYFENLREQWPELGEEQRTKHLKQVEAQTKDSDLEIRQAATELLTYLQHYK
jgi:ribosome recycling factor